MYSVILDGKTETGADFGYILSTGEEFYSSLEEELYKQSAEKNRNEDGIRVIFTFLLADYSQIVETFDEDIAELTDMLCRFKGFNKKNTLFLFPLDGEDNSDSKLLEIFKIMNEESEEKIVFGNFDITDDRIKKFHYYFYFK